MMLIFFFNVKQTFSVNEFESGGNKAHEGQEKKKERERASRKNPSEI